METKPYDYHASMFSAIECWLAAHGYTPERIVLGDYDYDDLYEQMFISDDVTGNASGSYTFNSWKAEECLCHNLDLLGDAINEFGIDSETLASHIWNAEWCDVTIRCYLLGSCLNAVIGSIEAAENVEDYWYDYITKED